MEDENTQLIVAGATPAVCIPITEFDDGEPRVLDLDLARWLGYPRPLEIRKVIKRHLAEIQALGILGSLPRIQTGPGRPTVEFYPNEDQCIAISQLSRGPQAAEVRIALRRLFRAYKDGKLAPAVSADDVAIGQLCGELHRMSDAITQMATSMDRRLDHHDERMQHLDERLAGVEVGQKALADGIRDVRFHIADRRKGLTTWTKGLHVACVSTRRNGICPCCQEIVVCTPEARAEGAEFDHWYGRWRNQPDETWLVCSSCNRLLNASTEFKDRARSAFESYQQALRPFLVGGQLVLFQ